MHARKARSTNTGLLALFTVASLLLVTASPASAQEAITGEGGGTGWEYAGTIGTPCLPGVLPMGTTTFELDHTGTFVGVDATGETSAVYVGPTHVSIVVESHVFSPAGVGPSCMPPAPLGPVPVKSATVTSPPGGPGNVNCTSAPLPLIGEGQYERVTSAVSFQLALECTVAGNQPVLENPPPPDHDPVVDLFMGSVGPATTVMTIAGTMNPCEFPVIDPTNNFDPIFFVHNPECDLTEPPATNPGGEPSSHLVTTYEAVGGEPTPF